MAREFDERVADRIMRRLAREARVARSGKQIRCDRCGNWYPEEDVCDDRDEEGHRLGRFCLWCI